MRIDVVHFMPSALNGVVDEAGKMSRAGFGATGFITGKAVIPATPFFFCRSPIRTGVNAAIVALPIGADGKLCAYYRTSEIDYKAPVIVGYACHAIWQIFKDVLPPREVIESREAERWEKAVLDMSADYWKDFTRLAPEFAEINAPAFLKTPKSFDECFVKVSKPLAKNFQRDMAIILLWKYWRDDWSMTLPKAVEVLAQSGFKVDADALRKIRDKYSLPSFNE